MKETRFFFVPDARNCIELPQDEAKHATRVLRLAEGDELMLMDGSGCFYRAYITVATGHRCLYKIFDFLPQERAWEGHIHLAMAPTKLNDRTEWFAEKATEIGMDELTFLDCQFSERRVIKTERIDKILISAVKQSHKAWKPILNEMTPFERFVKTERKGDKFICHCYAQEDIEEGGTKPLLMDVLRRGVETTVMIGPEGDFSVDEVKLALKNGYRCVSLGTSRLRTETAALVAVHMMQLRNQKIG
ncbi:MAG: 16S rRNA (uracil(1498)-N(3))-methyltransferase [Bacteroidaceae bacterium]|nr:16S rRNA (uracil(1498)-N(3))-methyltransferase [Bacteroidaceae bacterium]